MPKPINPKALVKCVDLLDKQKQLRATADELVRSIDARISMVEEFIRANYTGDTKAFNVLKEEITANKVRPYPYYRDRPRLAGCPTRLLVKQAQEHVKCLNQTCSGSNSTTPPAKPTSA